MEIDAAEKIFGAVSRYASVATGVVFRALFRIGKDGVRGGNFFELFFGARFFVAIGMIFERKLAKSVFDRLRIGVARNAENFVKVTLWGGGNGGGPALVSYHP